MDDPPTIENLYLKIGLMRKIILIRYKKRVFWKRRNYLVLEESNEKLSFRSIFFITFESNPINDVIFSRPLKKKLMRIQRSLFIGTED